MHVKYLEQCQGHSKCSTISYNYCKDGDDDAAYVQGWKKRKITELTMCHYTYVISPFELYELDILLFPLYTDEESKIQGGYIFPYVE